MTYYVNYSLSACKTTLILRKAHGNKISLQSISSHISGVSALIKSMIYPYEQYIDLFCTIPDIKRKSAITIISNFGIDMSQFSNHHFLYKWTVLSPGQNESSGKKKSVRISKAGFYLKLSLVEVAHAAINDKQNLNYAIKFDKTRKRRDKKQAYIAIARIILVAIYHMFSTGEVFSPKDLANIEIPIEQRINYISKSYRHSVKQLNSAGLTVEQIHDIIQVPSETEVVSTV